MRSYTLGLLILITFVVAISSDRPVFAAGVSVIPNVSEPDLSNSDRCILEGAEAAADRNDKPDARRILRQSALQPKHSRWFYACRSAIYQKIGDVDAAIADMKLHFKTTGDPLSWYSIASLYNLQGRTKDALDAALKEVQLNKRSESGLFLFVELLLQDRQFDKAEKYLQLCRSRKLTPESRILSLEYFLKAQRAFDAGKLDEAATLFESAVNSNSESGRLTWSAAKSYSAKGQKRAALKLYLESAKAVQFNTQMWLDVINLAIECKDKEVGARAIKQYVAFLPQFSMNGQEAQWLFELGCDEEAVSAAERALANDPGCLSALLVCGAIYLRTNQYDAAEKCFRKALDARPGSLAVQQQLLGVLWRQKKYAEAEELIQSSSLSPGDKLLERAETAYRANQYRKALTYLKELLAKNPTDFRALTLRGKIYKGILLDDLAVSDFEAALRHGAAASSVKPDLIECRRRAQVVRDRQSTAPRGQSGPSSEGTASK